jgi:hypothetical protein
MVESGRCPRFVHESELPVGIGDATAGQNLKRNQTIEASVPSLVNLSHAAFAEFGNNTVVRDRLFRTHRFWCSASYHFADVFAPLGGKLVLITGSGVCNRNVVDG